MTTHSDIFTQKSHHKKTQKNVMEVSPPFCHTFQFDLLKCMNRSSGCLFRRTNLFTHTHTSSARHQSPSGTKSLVRKNPRLEKPPKNCHRIISKSPSGTLKKYRLKSHLVPKPKTSNPLPRF